MHQGWNFLKMVSGEFSGNPTLNDSGKVIYRSTITLTENANLVFVNSWK